MCSIDSLPREVIVHIFKYYLSTETQHDLVYSVGNVCSRWRDAVMAHTLWNKFDGSLSSQDFLRLFQHGCMCTLTDLTFSKMSSLSLNFVRSISSSLPRLEKIDFSNVTSFTPSGWTELVNQCVNISEVVRCKASSKQMRVDEWEFFKLFEVRGQNLVSINISYSSIFCKSIFKSIAAFCPNLKELKAANLTSPNIKFPIQRMQVSCPKLRVLQLGHPIRFQQLGTRQTHGFRDMEIFSHVEILGMVFCDLTLVKLLSKSTKLKALDVRGCVALTARAVLLLPCELEELYISQTGVTKSPELEKVLLKWHHSLKELDVSRTITSNFNSSFCPNISVYGMNYLERLYLNNTNVEPDALISILTSCSKLVFLQLENCRSIKRRLRHVYKGRHEILELLNKLNKDI